MYEDLIVNKDGTIYRQEGSKPSIYFTADGYHQFKYRDKHARVHRVVAEIYLLNPEGLSDVNHKDGNKDNNHVDNLEWCSRKDNLLHAMRTGLHANPERAVVGWNPKTGDGVWFVSTAEAGRHGFTQPNVVHCLKGNRKTCKGYQWEYA